MRTIQSTGSSPPDGIKVHAGAWLCGDTTAAHTRRKYSASPQPKPSTPPMENSMWNEGCYKIYHELFVRIERKFMANVGTYRAGFYL